MNILILGANGFFGSYLSKELSLTNHNVYLYDRGCSNIETLVNNKNVFFTKGNFNKLEYLEILIKKCDCIIHLISTTNPKSALQNIFYDVDTNLISTLKLLELLPVGHIKRFIFASSGGTVYGPSKPSLITEQHPTNPITPYGICKLSIERYIHFYSLSKKFNFSILRISNLYGVGQKSNVGQGVISTFIDSALNNKNIEIWGNGESVRDYIYVTDAVQLLLKTIEESGANRILNLSSSVGTSVNGIIDIIEELLNFKVKRNYVNTLVGTVDYNVLSNSLAAEIYKWQPKITIKNGIKLMVDHLKNI